MVMILDHPVGQSIALPFVLVVAAGFVAAKVADQGKATKITSISVGLAILASYLATFGFPPIPARTSGQKLFFVLALFAATGSISDILRPKLVKPIFVLIGVTGLIWFAGPSIIQQPTTVIPLCLGICLLWHVTASEAERLMQRGNNGLWIIIFLSVSLSVLAATYDSLSIAQTSLSIVSCIAGLFVYAFSRSRVYVSWSIIYVSFGPLLALVSQTLLYGGPWRHSLFPLFGILFVDRTATWARDKYRLNTAAYRVFLMFAYLGPVAISLILAMLSANPEDLYN
jgi:hypothetical protein